MQSSLLLTTDRGISELFNPSWSFTRGTMAVARLLKAAAPTGLMPFDRAFLVNGSIVAPAEVDVTRGPETTQVVFFDPKQKISSYIVTYQH
jgi:hypothetical protein